MNMCLILTDYQDRSAWIYTSKRTVNGKKEREITYC